MGYTKLKKINLVEEVYEQLKNSIVSGEYREGDKLLSENKLCEKFGVSRVVVRGAMYQLRANWLIVTFKGKGSFVANPENFEHTDFIPTFEEMSIESLQDFFEFHNMFSFKSIELAAKNANSYNIEKIQKIHHQMAKSIGDLEAFTESDFSFHLAVVEATNNKYMLKAYKSCSMYIKNCFKAMNSINNSADWGVEGHKEILDAIISGDYKTCIENIKIGEAYNLARVSTLKNMEKNSKKN
jgi:GntR family transcriptional repressor for pyruvate dehydrogenase complex